MELDQTIGQTRVQVISGGDVRTEEADALIMAITSELMWTGYIDRAVRSVAGELYHGQARMALLTGRWEPPRKASDPCATLVAQGHRSQHGGAFDQVVFVLDDLRTRLRNVIEAGLSAADGIPARTVAIPGIRLGKAIGLRENSIQEVYDETEAGIVGYLTRNPGTHLRHVKYVLRD